MKRPAWYPLATLLACVLGFVIATACEVWWTGTAREASWASDRLVSFIGTVLAFWVVLPNAGGESRDWLRAWIEGYLAALGYVLVTQAALVYLVHVAPLQWPVIAGGTTLSIVFSALLSWTTRDALQAVPDTLLVGGSDPVEAELLEVLRPRLLGVLESDPARVPSGIPYLGLPESLESVAAAHRPARVITGSYPDPVALLRLRAAGIRILPPAVLYENLLGRVPGNGAAESDLLFSASLNTTATAMALQAIYNNLVGLTLLLISMPVLLAAGLLVGLFSGPGPVIERIECAGFQRIPFQLRRFRIRRQDGTPTRIGRVLTALRLVNLPGLVNIVRGEISLVGPPAARLDFAERLSAMIPQYSQRFLMKPGVIGWAQVNLHRLSDFPEELERLEYDLYYVKSGNPSLDMEVFLRTTLVWRGGRKSRVDETRATGAA